MPIANTDLVLYTSVNRPQDDTSTSGGAIDTTWRPEFTQFGSSARVSLISDGADTRLATVLFRDGTGAIITENIALNGTVEVLTVGVAERLLSVSLSATSTSRTVTVREGTGGVTRGTINLNQVGITGAFINSASQSTAVNRYEKFFWRNNHASLTLSSAVVTLTADPSSRIKIGLAASKGDSVSLTNRLSVPGGITFVDDGVAINVPTGILAAGETIGVWVQEGLLANDSPFKSTYSINISGTSA